VDFGVFGGGGRWEWWWQVVVVGEELREVAMVVGNWKGGEEMKEKEGRE